MTLRTSFPAAIGLVSSLLLGTVLIMPQAYAVNPNSPNACSNATLNGSFGFYRTGVSTAGPLAAIGIGIFDGKGNMTGSQSISRGGAYDFDIPIGASYQLAADCTGKGYAPDGSEFFRIVVVDGGNGFYLFSESPGNAIYGVGRKIESADD